MDFFIQDTPENREKYFAEMEEKLKIIPKHYREQFYTALIIRIRYGEIGVIIAGEFEKVLFKNLRRLLRKKIDYFIDNSYFFSFADVYKRISFIDKKIFSFNIIFESFEVEVKEYRELHIHNENIYCSGRGLNCYASFIK